MRPYDMYYNDFLGYENMGGYNKFRNYREFQNYRQQEDSNPNSEILSFTEAIDSIRESIGDEKSDEMFYDEIIKKAPSDREKEIIKSIRDDEKKHNKILRNLYFKFTNQMIQDNESTNNENKDQNKTYKEMLDDAFFGELEAVKRYRRILGAMPKDDSYTLIMSIMTDELRHADKYNYLIHKAG